MSLHQTLLIVSILVWCAYVNTEGARQVNCEVYVYHPNCRGMQARKRFMNIPKENDRTEDPACPCKNSKSLRNDIDPVASSKLLEAMFAKGFNVDTIYDAYTAAADRRRSYNANKDRSNLRGRSIKGVSTDFGIAETDEDY